MLTISIQHSIYLSKKERYNLHEQKEVDVVGVSVPVWHLENKTSEPAKEIFCNYYLRNPKKEIPIKTMNDGYLICLPYKIPTSRVREISNEDWLKLNQEQREAYYTAIPNEISSTSLLDIQDGGSETLMYRESNTIKNGDKFIKIVHYVNIYSIDYLKTGEDYESRRQSS